jgi:hypothetical protein
VPSKHFEAFEINLLINQVATTFSTNQPRYFEAFKINLLINQPATKFSTLQPSPIKTL